VIVEEEFLSKAAIKVTSARSVIRKGVSGLVVGAKKINRFCWDVEVNDSLTRLEEHFQAIP
jgi:hypothetical protein